MKFFEKVHKARKNNKGFTLVELIIVIAIIAVLAAVLAPRYLQYVERSRQSNDLQVATNIIRAATAAVADPNNDATADEYTFTWTTQSGTAGDAALNISAAAGATEILASVAEVMGWPAPAAGSRGILTDADAESTAGNDADFIFTIHMDNGNITMARASLDGDGAADSNEGWGTAGVGLDYGETP